MNIAFIIAGVVIVVLCIALIGIILMQSKNASGLTGAIGGMGGAQTYWDKNKGRSLEGQLEKYTKIIAGVLFILILVMKFIAK